MLVIDEYLAIEVLVGDWPPAVPDDEPLALPASRHFRLLQRIHQPSGGQLSSALERLSPAGDVEEPFLARVVDIVPGPDERAIVHLDIVGVSRPGHRRAQPRTPLARLRNGSSGSFAVLCRW